MFTFALLAVFYTLNATAGNITIDQADFDAWLPKQTITGSVSVGAITEVVLHVNGGSRSIKIDAKGCYSTVLQLSAGENKIWLTTVDSLIRSRLLTICMRYKPVALLRPYIIIRHGNAVLCHQITDPVAKVPIHYTWSADKGNTGQARLIRKVADREEWEIPPVDGRYFFTLNVSAGGDSLRYSTYLTRKGTDLKPYDPEHDPAPWIRQAVLYEVTPDKFVPHGRYADVQKKLPEIAGMGINTLWLQPVWRTLHGHQGYDVTDYFSLRPDLGTEEELHRLIRTAKSLKMRVILDFVPNHTSTEHPYARDCIAHKHASHYYDFYQRKKGDVPYSSALHKDKHDFYYYFWDDLINLNFDHPEVRQWIMQACAHWLQELDLDGFRMDALWAVRARRPDFIKQLATTLKSIKPDLLLVAEDKKDILRGLSMLFDAAYDWTSDTAWISQWSWNLDLSRDHYTTIFNFPAENKRCNLLRKALFNDSAAPILRFIENNDLPRFLSSHSILQEKVAAALVFMLPGLPMIYNGQEVGARHHPYSPFPIFNADSTIRIMDSLQLYGYYAGLARIRREYPVLQSPYLREVRLSDGLVSFLRWEEGRTPCLIVVNPCSTFSTADIPLSIFGKEGRLTDLLSAGWPESAAQSGRIDMPAFSIRCLTMMK